MPKKILMPLVLAVALLNSAFTPYDPPSCQSGAAAPGAAEANKLLDSYLQAVDRGELLTFERRLTRADINPVNIQFTYQIASGVMQTRVHSSLKEPMPVPGQPEYQVVGVCSAMEDGRIVETESHVLVK